jgi:hypothetical protein
MRGDPLAWQWRMIQAIEASPDGQVLAEIYKPDGAQGQHKREALQKPIPKWDGLFCYEGPKPISGWDGNE